MKETGRRDHGDVLPLGQGTVKNNAMVTDPIAWLNDSVTDSD